MKTFKEFLSITEQQVIGPTTQTPYRKPGGKQVAPGVKMIDTTKDERRKDAYKRATGGASY